MWHVRTPDHSTAMAWFFILPYSLQANWPLNVIYVEIYSLANSNVLMVGSQCQLVVLTKNIRGFVNSILTQVYTCENGMAQSTYFPQT